MDVLLLSRAILWWRGEAAFVELGPGGTFGAACAMRAGPAVKSQSAGFVCVCVLKTDDYTVALHTHYIVVMTIFLARYMNILSPL